MVPSLRFCDDGSRALGREHVSHSIGHDVRRGSHNISVLTEKSFACYFGEYSGCDIVRHGAIRHIVREMVESKLDSFSRPLRGVVSKLVYREVIKMVGSTVEVSASNNCNSILSSINLLKVHRESSKF
jgi:hypothetical protein